jgi:hypothetical protein
MKGFNSPRKIEDNSSILVVFFNNPVFLPDNKIMNKTEVEVKVAMVSIVRMSSYPNPILKTVGIVDQKKTASPA